MRSGGGPDAQRRVPPTPVLLDQLGMHPGETIRWRRRPNERWQPGEVVGLERDGSLAIRDTKGAARAIPLALVEVGVPPRRRGAKPGWEPLLARAGRTEQLRLGTGP